MVPLIQGHGYLLIMKASQAWGSVKSGVGGYLLIMKASQTWFP